MHQPPQATEAMRRCPECGYTLVGLRELICPECGRQTNEDELARIARAREVPRNLVQIALMGVIFALMLSGWSFASLLISARGDGRNMGMYAIGLAVSILAIGPGVWVWRRMREIHARSEVWAWIAAHGAWVGAIAAVICIA